MKQENNSPNTSQVVSYVLIGIGSLTMLSGLPFFDIFPLAIGGAMTWWGLRMNNQARRQRQLTSYSQSQAPKKFEMDDRMFSRLAERLGGKVSAEDVAKQTSLSLDEAKKRLEALHLKGVCSLDVNDIDEQGRIYYRF